MIASSAGLAVNAVVHDPESGASGTVPIRVLVADDNELVRCALRDLLLAEGDMAVVAEASDGRQAVELALRTTPHVVVLDVHMPVLDGVAATEELSRRCPPVRVLMLTGSARRATVRDAFTAGARGYLLKNGDPDALIAGIRACAAGGRPLTAELSAPEPSEGPTEDHEAKTAPS